MDLSMFILSELRLLTIDPVPQDSLLEMNDLHSQKILDPKASSHDQILAKAARGLPPQELCP